MKIHNCHTHTFTVEAVPEYFLPLGLIRFLARREFSRPLARFLNHLNPFSSDDLFDRFAAFITIGASKKQQDIFQGMQKYYPANTQFVVLSMDMEYMEAGPIPQSFEAQLSELNQLKQESDNLCLPFVGVDPRRNEITNLTITYLAENEFSGIKLYPPLGYFPYDSRLEELYRYAQEERIPITSHTSPLGVYYRGKREKLREFLQECKLGNIDIDKIVNKLKKNKKVLGTSQQKICSFFTHPVQYLYLLNQYPELKIDLAHFGGNDDWNDYIDNPPSPEYKQKYAQIVAEIKLLFQNNSRTENEQKLLENKIEEAFELNWLELILQILKEYNHVYADISYTLNNENYFPLLKSLLQDSQVRTKILFGSDYYMAQIATFEDHFSVKLREYLGEADYQQIAETNPQAFLFDN